MGITTNRQQPEYYQFVGTTRKTVGASAWTQVAHTETTSATRDLYIIHWGSILRVCFLLVQSSIVKTGRLRLKNMGSQGT